jgi:hypothetical protein
MFDKLTCPFFFLGKRKAREDNLPKNINQPKARDLFLNLSAWLLKKNF